MEPTSADQRLATERLVLRRLRASDAAPIARLMNNWNVVRTLAGPPYPYSLENAESYLSQDAARGNDPTQFNWAVTAGDELIGNIGYTRDEDGKASVGYWLGEPYWGRGLMSEAAQMVVCHFFSSQRDNVLFSGIFAGNSASLKVQEKLGFEVIGHGEKFAVAHGSNMPHVDTQLTRQRYEAMQL